MNREDISIERTERMLRTYFDDVDRLNAPRDWGRALEGLGAQRHARPRWPGGMTFKPVTAAVAATLVIAFALVAVSPWETDAPGGEAAQEPAATPPLIAGHGVWAYQFTTVEEGLALADALIVGEVIETRPGRTVTTGRHQFNYTDNVIAIREQLAGSLATEQIVLSQPGGGNTPFFLDHPPFKPGEVVVLFVRAIQSPPDQGSYMSVNPNGRFDLVEGRLQSVADPRAYPFQEALDGKSLDELRALVASVTRP